MRVLITGSSGLIGSHLIPFLEDGGNDVHRMIRNKNKVDETHLFWDPENGDLDVESIDNFQVIIHLAGENISSRRWSERQKDKISQSRLASTRLLVEKLRKIKVPPQLFICASAIGYYGNRGEEILTESSHKGEGFFTNLVEQWEEIASHAEENGVRVVQLRTGVVLSTCGGALTKVLLPFKLGLGTIIGNGKQYMPWISQDDVNGVIDFIIKNEAISGPVNVVAPETITNYEYSHALGKALSRPVFLKLPGSILRLALGEMAEQLLLSSSKVVPKVLTDHGFKFLHPSIDQAFSAIFNTESIFN